jgi:hypothetical protein
VTAAVATLTAVIAALAVHEVSGAVLLAACGLAARMLERHIRRRVVAAEAGTFLLTTVSQSRVDVDRRRGSVSRSLKRRRRRS